MTHSWAVLLGTALGFVVLFSPLAGWSALVVVGVLAINSAVGASRAPATPGIARAARSAWYWIAAVCAFSAAVVLSPLFAHLAVPAYNHDWGSYPLFPEQMSAWGAYTVRAWLPDGLGHPNAFPFNYPVQLVGFCLGTLLGPAGGIRMLLWVELTLAGIAFAAFAARCGVERTFARCVGAMLFISTPVVTNKLAAGHWPYLAAYAAVPTIAFLACDATARPRPRLVFLLGAAIAIAAAQPQFFAFVLGFLVVFVAFNYRRPQQLAVVVAAFALALLLQLPGIYPLAANVSTGYLSVERATSAWQEFQSVLPQQTMQLVGYIGRYDARTYVGAAALIPGIFAVFLSIGAVTTGVRSKAFYCLGLVTAFALFAEMGVHAPGGDVIARAFAAHEGLTVLRELYDVALFPALFGCAVFAILIERAAGVVRIASVAFTIAALLVARGFAAFLHYETDSGLARAVSVIANARGNERVFWLPAPAPLGTSAAESGLDPMTVPIGTHPALQGNLITPLTGYLQASVYHGHIDVGFLKSVGVRWIAVRRDVQSRVSNVAPSLRRHIMNANLRIANTPIDLRNIGRYVIGSKSFSLIDLGPNDEELWFATEVRRQHGWATALALHAAQRHVAVVFDDPVRTIALRFVNVDPTVDVVSGAYWFWLDPALSDVPRYGAMTIQRELCVPNDTRVFETTTWTTRRAGCYRSRIIAADPGRAREANDSVTARRLEGGAVLRKDGSWVNGRITGTYVARGTGLMVFNVQYDNRWRCLVDGTPRLPRLVNAFQMGFWVPGGSHAFALYYEPEATLRLAFAGDALLWFIVLCCALPPAWLFPVQRRANRKKPVVPPVYPK